MDVIELDARETDAATALRATQALEDGGVVVFPDLPFPLEPDEARFLDPAILTRSKNVSLDPSTGALGGAQVGKEDQVRLASMLARFSARADALLAQVTPGYTGALQKRRTSFRPGAVAERALSARKDDRRLHVDAFPSNPVQGRRILRVFANVNPNGEPRLWDIAEEGFKSFAERFVPELKRVRGGGRIMERLGLTKGRRSAYDSAMLTLHDAAKLDEAYQATAQKRRLSFPAGSMWIVYTDGTLHAALSGQHAFEQTYLLPVDAMDDVTKSPVRILESLTGKALV